ncbi:phospholipase D1-like [Lampetra fluviatilis]
MPRQTNGTDATLDAARDISSGASDSANGAGPPPPSSPGLSLSMAHLVMSVEELEELGATEETDSHRRTVEGRIPFVAVFHLSQVKSAQGYVFLDSAPIRVRVTEVEKTGNSKKMERANMYTVRFSHGDFSWDIKRKYKDFQQLHHDLQRYRALHRILEPARSHLERRRTVKPKREGADSKIPELPNRLEGTRREDPFARREDYVSSRKKQIENYLSGLLQYPVYRNHPATLEFLEVSGLSFIADLGPKGIEGYIEKRSGGYKMPGLHCCGKREVCFRWSKRWLAVKDSFVLYMKLDEGKISSVMLFDSDFVVKIGQQHTEVRSGVVIQNLTRTLTIKCPTFRHAMWWGKSLQQFAETHGKDYMQPNRFESFAPVREKTLVRWFVNSSQYFTEMAYALEEAKEEIFITDWWLSPEIFLKRPPVEGNYWRLDSVLKRKAEAGVRVFVLLYKEVGLALGLNSDYSKQKLMGLHPNIKVLRHPDHVSSTVLFWAHHEKLVVIDQTVAFLGGIDLAYGRWDDYQHRLTDIGSVQRTNVPGTDSPSRQPKAEEANGKSNPGLTVEQQQQQQEEEAPPDVVDSAAAPQEAGASGLRESSTDAERPAGSAEADADADAAGEAAARPGKAGWKRAMQAMKTASSESGREEQRYRATRRRTDSVDEEDADAAGTARQNSNDVMDGIVHRWRSMLKQRWLDKPKYPLRMHKMHIREDYGSTKRTSVELFGEARFWHGKDYCNFVLKDWVQLEKPFDDFIDRYTTPRMPWHDIGAVVHGHAARDVARHFIQRWNFAMTVKKKKSIEHFPLLLPKSLSMADRIPYVVTGCVAANVQVLRSASDWSVGIKKHEESIHKAYVEAIRGSRHYIYIENQFFISCTDNRIVWNGIGDAIVDKILEAHRDGRRFRVYVVVPLLPGFEGDISTGGGSAIQAVLHFNYRTLCRGKYSIIERLKVDMGNSWMNYISVCGLRTHAELAGTLVTELIYVHSKLMIVDDRTVIIGSANINDRSMLGKRDSEMAVMVEDTEFQESVMDGQPYQAGRFAYNLRNCCFRLVLGLLDSPHVDISDPISDHFYKEVWMSTAAINATVYEKVFMCLPSDFVLSLKDLENWGQNPLMQTDPAQAREELQKVQGFLVTMPLGFLQEENLLPAFNTKEGMMPTDLWT